MLTALAYITIIVAILYVVLLVFYTISWHQVKTPETEKTIPSLKISVIIPARNEEKNIGACLQSIIAQNYPAELFEIIVIDDFSEDRTAEVVFSFSNKNIKLLQLKKYIEAPINSYKKKAVEIAVNGAGGELIVQTDADCIVTETWLNTIAAFYQKTKAKFIAMPVSILPSTFGEGLGVRRFIEMFQALDFMTLQGITAASVYKKFHSMCNGANMAYTKKAFEAVNGFRDIDGIASGDDMLLMHKIAKAFPADVYFLKDEKVIVNTEPVHSVKEFFNQRIRWASKADKYDDRRITSVLVVVYLFNCLLAATIIFAGFSDSKLSIINYQLSIFETAVIILLLKTAFELLFLFPVARFFHKTSLLYLFPVFQPFHILYTIVAGFLGKFGRYSWKGRTVK